MQEGDGHAENRWACRKEMDPQEGDGHTGRRWAYVNGMGMQVVLCIKQIITDLDKQIRLLDHTSCFGVELLYLLVIILRFAEENNNKQQQQQQ